MLEQVDIASWSTPERLRGRLIEREAKLQEYAIASSGDHDAKFDVRQSVEAYLTHTRAVNPEQFNVMLDCRDQFAATSVAQRVQNTRLVFAIPVAGHQETRAVDAMLRAFSKRQDSSLEVYLLLNRPKVNDAKTERKDERTLQSIKQAIDNFRQANNAQVHVAESVFAEQQTIGDIRRKLWGAVAIDLLERGRRDDIFVVSMDADTLAISNNYIDEVVRHTARPETDIVTTKLHWGMPRSLPGNSLVGKVLRFQSFLDNVSAHAGNIHTPDANTAVSLAAYANAGGFNSHSSIGEFYDLKSRLFGLRNAYDEAYERSPEKNVRYACSAWLKTDSRRLLASMALGHSPYDAWDQDKIKFGANDEVRTMQAPEQRAEEQAKENYLEWLKTMISSDYFDGIHPDKRRRLLRAGLRIIDIGVDLEKFLD